MIELHIGDTLTLKKKHPCGGHAWSVTRLGADIGLMCTTCSRRILLPRSDVELNLKQKISTTGSTL